jgi:hypothetical protein
MWLNQKSTRLLHRGWIFFSGDGGYTCEMNTTTNPLLLESALAARPGRFLLVATLGMEREKITEVIGQLALRGPVTILAGSDWLPGDRLARSLRRSTVEVSRVLERASLARAFTCYQLANLLGGVKPDGAPLLVLDFLHTFYSPDIPLPVRIKTLKQCCQHLQRLSRSKPVAVMLRQQPVEDYRFFYPFLAVMADEILLPAQRTADATQAGLF